jgi:predicted solute-binding protein
MQHLEQVASASASDFGLSKQQVLEYFTISLSYSLDAPKMAAIERYLKEAESIQLPVLPFAGK